MTDAKQVIAQTRHWIEKLVIGQRLCPFAAQPFAAEKIRYRVSEAKDPEALSEHLVEELFYLRDVSVEEVETTLLIHPEALTDFSSYLDYLSLTEFLLEKLELTGIIQLASFHPHYQFADTAIDAPENFTNRSPYPMLHLLREAQMAEALEHFPNPEQIPQRNIETMNRLGFDLLTQWYDDITGKN